MGKVARYSWGIDVGNCTLKAIKLGATPEGVEVLDFAVIEYEKILSGPEMDAEQRSEIVTGALSDFLQEHDTRGCAIIVSVPGQNSFARFIKLPPVESKRVPELVRFEAIQQIPFDINEVEWDWQTFSNEGSPEVEVGIFAIKKDLVSRAMEPFTQLSCGVTGVQMAPIALYNFMRYDQKRHLDAAGKEAVVAMDIGADNTDLVISDGLRVWQRNIPIGGNHFTAAVQKAFKLSFTKAEEIKRTANTSKYARQIFQAMRSVFADLAAEIQRSLGFYSSSNRNVRFREALALGNAMKLPGLTKFLQQSLSLPVRRMDSFESLRVSSGVSAAKFAENLPSMAGVYGLALQGLGLATISSDLLPGTIARQSQWKGKRAWFVGSVAVVIMGSLLFLAQVYSQRADIRSDTTKRSLNDIEGIKRLVGERSTQMQKSKSEIDAVAKKAEELGKYYGARTILTQLMEAIRHCLPNKNNVTDPQQKKMLEAYQQGDRKTMMEMARDLREQVFLTSVKVIYVTDMNEDFGSAAQKWASSSLESRGVGGPSMSPAGMGGPSREGGMMMREGGMRGGFGNPMMGQPMEQPSGGAPGGEGTGEGGETPSGPEAEKGGYVVILEGYTPNKGNLAFLSPPDVGLKRENWGFFNRLRYLGKTDQEIIGEQVPSGAAVQPGPGMNFGQRPGMPTPGVAGPGTAGEPGGEAKPTEGGEAGSALKLIAPTGAYQTAENQAAKTLTFETYIDFQKPLERSFDTAESDWITSGQSSQFSQPAGLGIWKPQTATSPSVGTASMPGMGMRRESPMAGGQSGNVVGQQELMDPFTFEIISTTYALDDNGQMKLDAAGKPIPEKHDYWFRVKMKIKIKTAAAKNAPGEGATNPAPGTGNNQ